MSEGAWGGNKDLERERQDDEENKEDGAKANPSVLVTDGKVFVMSVWKGRVKVTQGV